MYNIHIIHFIHCIYKIPLNELYLCLNHLFVKCCDETFLKNIQICVIQIEITDHCPIIASIPLVKFEHQNRNTIKHIDYGLIKY
jgi:hypothetical protein